MTHTLTTATIATDCTEKRALAVVAALQAAGWQIEYGDVTNVPNTPAFVEAFYEALDEVDYGMKPRQ